MSLRDLFIAKSPPQSGRVNMAAPPANVGAPAAPVANNSGTPVFLTPQSLVTFPGASLAVLILWKTLAQLLPSWGSTNGVAIILSLLVGALIYYMSLTNTMDTKDKILGAFLALLNACYVALFVIGVPLTIQNNLPTSSSSPVSPSPPAETKTK